MIRDGRVQVARSTRVREGETAHSARSPREARASATTPACEVARPARDGRTTGAIAPAAVIGSALALA